MKAITKEKIEMIKREGTKFDNTKIIKTVRAYFSGGVSTVINCTERDLFEIKELGYNFSEI